MIIVNTFAAGIIVATVYLGMSNSVAEITGISKQQNKHSQEIDRIQRRLDRMDRIEQSLQEIKESQKDLRKLVISVIRDRHSSDSQ